MRCVSCGHEELALPTVRWRKSVKGQKFVLCESCLDAPLRSYAWLVPGDFSVPHFLNQSTPLVTMCGNVETVSVLLITVGWP